MTPLADLAVWLAVALAHCLWRAVGWLAVTFMSLAGWITARSLAVLHPHARWHSDLPALARLARLRILFALQQPQASAPKPPLVPQTISPKISAHSPTGRTPAPRHKPVFPSSRRFTGMTCPASFRLSASSHPAIKCRTCALRLRPCGEGQTAAAKLAAGAEVTIMWRTPGARAGAKGLISLGWRVTGGGSLRGWGDGR